MNTKRPFVSTSIFFIVGRAGGFLIPFFIALYYGVGFQTDAFFIAFGVINFLMVVFSQLFESVLLPYLAEQKKKHPQDASDFVNGVFWYLSPFLGLFCLAAWWLLSQMLTRISGWSESQVSLASGAFAGLTPFLFFGIWSAVGNGIFYAYRIFWFPALSPLIRYLTIVIGLYLLRNHFGIYALLVGFMAGELFRWAAGVLVLSHLRLWRFRVNWTRYGGKVKTFFKDSLMQLAAAAAVNAIFFVDLGFASLLGEGNVSLLSYADRLLQVAYLFFQGGFSQIFHSVWAETYYEKPLDAVLALIQNNIKTVFVITLVLSLAVWLARMPIILLVFNYGKFLPGQLELMSSFFGWLVLGFAPSLAYLLYVRFLFVLREFTFYFYLSWIQLLAKVALNFFLIKRFGLQGIAIGTAILYGLLAGVLHVYVKNRKNDPAKRGRENVAY